MSAGEPHDPSRTVPRSDPDAVGAGPAPCGSEASTVAPTGDEASGPDHRTRVRASDSPAPVGPDGIPVLRGYELGREIARGGMGVVFAARDVELDREVAVKVMLPGMNAAEFVRESRITARLPHPGIPPVHALGTLPDGRPFLAMKLIQGETLKKILAARPDPAADRGAMVAAFEQICQTVGFAHAQGIVHRDLKPDNTMVGSFGEVQVMDWGLARKAGNAERGTQSEESEAGAEPSSVPHSAPRAPLEETVAGQEKGTPAYMAPEQARGERVDARADVFALGGILAAILTGKPPFVGTSVVDTIRRAARADLADIDARLAGCGADEELVAVAKRCLAARRETGRRPGGRWRRR